jgi:hypothetical protein
LLDDGLIKEEAGDDDVADGDGDGDGDGDDFKDFDVLDFG